MENLYPCLNLFGLGVETRPLLLAAVDDVQAGRDAVEEKNIVLTEKNVIIKNVTYCMSQRVLLIFKSINAI